MKKCPACKTKAVPLPMKRGDTVTLMSKDGYLMMKWASLAPENTIQDTCYTCRYVLSTRMI